MKTLDNVKFIFGEDMKPISAYQHQYENPKYMQQHSITLCGSMRKHLDLFNEVITTAKSFQINVLSPQSGKKVSEEDGFVRVEGDPKISDIELEMYHLKQVYASNLVLVLNPGGRIGATTFSEILSARFFGKPILFLERPDDQQEKLVKDIVNDSAYQCYIDIHTDIEDKIWELRRIIYHLDKTAEYVETRYGYIPTKETLVRPL